MLFSTEMVRAILDGGKTMTRRVIKPQPKDCAPDHKLYYEAKWKDEPADFIIKDGFAYCQYCGNGTTPKHDYAGIKVPHPIGTIIWVKETFEDFHGGYNYRAGTYGLLGEKWTPSIFMPRKAARIFLEVVDVRVERLHRITWDDAVAEGCPGYRPTQDEPTDQFKRLWESINGEESWKESPYVWVISFKKMPNELPVQASVARNDE